MEYRERKPGGAMARFVKTFWMLVDGSPAGDEQRVVPDGRPELIFNLGSPFEGRKGEAWIRQPQSFIAGQITQPLLLRPTGPAHIVGVRFHPQGASEMLGMPLAEFTDATVTLDDFSPALHSTLQRLGEAKHENPLAVMAELLAEFCPVENDRRITSAVSEFESSAGMAEVSDVAERVGMSSRQLQRRFRDAVGISPKLFSRMQRFQRVFRAMEPGLTEKSPMDWVDVAVDCGYYDQAHLIRDFREFTGTTPVSVFSNTAGSLSG